MIISIKNITTSTISNEDGVKLKIAIENYLNDDNPVVLSFTGIDTISSSFLNSSLGEIIDKFGPQSLKNKIKIINYTPNIGNIISKYIRDFLMQEEHGQN